jgi:gliding motility-associated-like protein
MLKNGTIPYIIGMTALDEKLFVSTNYQGINVSLDAGQSWAQANSGLDLANDYFTSLFSYRGEIFAAGTNMGPYVSLDSGKTWSLGNNDPFTPTYGTTSFTAFDKTLFACGQAGVYETSIDRLAWNYMNQSLPILTIANAVSSLGVSKHRLFAGTEQNGVWLWTPCIGIPEPTITVNQLNNYKVEFASSSSVGNQWFLNGEAIPGATDSTFLPGLEGIYSLQVTIDDCVSSSAGQPFELVRVPIITMPNVFTPNDDSLNSKFIPIHMENVQNASLQIINRWGQTIYRSDDIAAGWDGGSSPSAVYFYHISYNSKNGPVGHLTGWVELLR